MANPQKENGHVDIANDLVEAFARYFPGYSEGQVLWAILRKTYGWHKKEDSISISQIMEMTGKSRRTVIYCLQNLEAKKMITIKREKENNTKNKINKISLQKNYDLWVVQNSAPQVEKNRVRAKISSAKLRNIKKTDRGSAKLRKKVVQNSVNNVNSFAPTKETITKETIQKKGDIFKNTWKDFKEMRRKIKKPMTVRAEELLIMGLNRLSDNEDTQIAILNQSIMNSWQGVFPLKERFNNKDSDDENQPKYIAKEKQKFTPEQIAHNIARAKELAEGKFNMPETEGGE